MFEHHEKDKDKDKDIAKELHRIANVLEKLYDLANHEEQEHKLQKLNVVWHIKNEEQVTMSAGNVALNLTPSAQAVGVVTETNADGSIFTFNPANIQAVAQDNTIVAVTADPTTGNIIVKPLAVGSTQVAVGDSVTGLSATYTFAVTALSTNPTSLSVTWTVTPSAAAAKKV